MEPVKVIHVATAGNYVLIKYNEKAISHANFVRQKLSRHQFSDNSQFVPKINQVRFCFLLL
jgi:hypothetical protein